MKETAAAIFLFLIAVFAFVLSIRSFLRKGFLLNNAYLYASAQERKTIDKKPYYRQSAVVFLLIGCIFALNGCAVIFHIKWISHIAAALVFGTIVYAIASSVSIGKHKHRK